MVLSGHQGTVSDVKCQDADPQVITGSMDSLCDYGILPRESLWLSLPITRRVFVAQQYILKYSRFASGSAQSIKQWKCPEGAFIFEGVNGTVNTLSVNEDDILFSGSDNGEMFFFRLEVGYKFQTGLWVTGEADRTIKVWTQDDSATEETQPLD
ncbi:hypothetical protein BGX38DRAFT_1251047 [Terfezia claveryi]|nr:hypothetical protein BGX38DRAFT_1251047 [Terfezia claveryi]